METRSIKISLDKAREWYRSGNVVLKELVLQVFTQKELETPDFSDIELMVGSIEPNREEYILKVLSEYYRKPTDRFYSYRDKYFIGKNNNDVWTIIKHSTVSYPGLAYYAREEDAKLAFEIFLREISCK